MIRIILRGVFIAVVAIQFSGIPLVVHYCDTARLASVSGCAMCEEPVDEVSCCEEEAADTSVPAYTSRIACCSETVLAVPLQTDIEKPLSQKNSGLIFFSFCAVHPVGEAHLLLERAFLRAGDSSPPGNSASLPILHRALLI